MFQRNAKSSDNKVDSVYSVRGEGCQFYSLMVRKQLSNGIYAKMDIQILSNDTISFNFLYYSKSDDTKSDLDFSFTHSVDKAIGRHSIVRPCRSDCSTKSWRLAPTAIELLKNLIFQCISLIDLVESKNPTLRETAIEVFLDNIYQHIIKFCEDKVFTALFSNLTSAMKEHENDLMNQFNMATELSGP